jgi:hypothetical protein
MLVRATEDQRVRLIGIETETLQMKRTHRTLEVISLPHAQSARHDPRQVDAL